MTIKELHSINEMIQEIEVMQELYPTLATEKYREMLVSMLPHNYKQVAVYDGGKCVGISGFWIGTKLWCGKYLELDNVIVIASYRSKGVGKIMSEYLEKKAIELNCNIQVLDAYTTNFKAHRFYYNQGFSPKGFHFIKILNEKEIR
ncbi:MAG: GNAT family N-acetyltransferase [Flavobacteriia bacterium]|nr:GNAT family N-acetyltransferase [Flavobacteriia bacterium]